MSLKLSLTNLAVKQMDLKKVAGWLHQNNFKGLEIAPTRIWGSWENIHFDEVKRTADDIFAHGLEVPSLQSLLFGKTELTLFGSNDNFDLMLKHFENFVLPVSKILKAPVLVFGSPKNRRAPEPLSDEMYRLACQRFSTLADLCSTVQSQLCIEANPSIYGCNFITDIPSAVKLIDDVNNPNFFLNFDVGCSMLSGQDPIDLIPTYQRYISHFHLSQPHLGSISTYLNHLESMFVALKKCNYNKWVSIEMLDIDDSQIRHCLEIVNNAYMRSG